MTTPDRITVDVRAVWTIAPEKDRLYPITPSAITTPPVQ